MEIIIALLMGLGGLVVDFDESQQGTGNDGETAIRTEDLADM